MEEVGQALMWRAVEAAPGLPRLGKRRRPGRAATDAYEEHMLLLDERVALMTNQRLMLLHAPGFQRIHEAAKEGVTPGNEDDIPVAETRWSVEWQVCPLSVSFLSGMSHVLGTIVYKRDFCRVVSNLGMRWNAGACRCMLVSCLHLQPSLKGEDSQDAVFV